MSRLQEQVVFQGISIITLLGDRQQRVQERLQETSAANSQMYTGDVCKRLQMDVLLFVEKLSIKVSTIASGAWSNGNAQEE